MGTSANADRIPPIQDRAIAHMIFYIVKAGGGPEWRNFLTMVKQHEPLVAEWLETRRKLLGVKD